ncbi:MAG TPA: DUF2520 domain-containing protein [Thermaerobacter sp.]
MRELGTNPNQHAILLVGPGRAGQALARGWHAAGVPVAWVVGRREEPARRLAEAVGARPLGWKRLRREGLPGPWPPVLVLAVPDRALEPVAQALAGVLAAVPPPRRPRHALHLSGALGLEPLAPLARLGLAPEVFHPLLPLPGGPAGRDRLAGGYVTVVYAPGQGRAPVGPALARALGATPVPWPGATAEQLALYHAAATLAANGVTALLWAAEELMGLSGYPGVQAAGASGVAGESEGPAGEAALADPAPRADALVPGAGAPLLGADDPLRGADAPVPAADAEAPAAPGRPALVALAAAALQAVAERGPLAALTGPIARGDVPTVRRHLRHLDALARRTEPKAGPRAAVVTAPGDHGRPAPAAGDGGLLGGGREGRPDPGAGPAGPATWYRLAAALVVAAASRLPEPPPDLDEIARLVGMAGQRAVPAPGSSPGRSMAGPSPGSPASGGPQGPSGEGLG